METTLCLIDAQTRFWHTAGNVQAQMINTLKHGLLRGNSLIVVEFGSMYPTHESLQCIVDEYPKYKRTIAYKYDDDGGHKVADAIAKASFNTDVLRVFGVNRCYCVWRTVHTLVTEYKMSVEIVSDAISCHNHCCGTREKITDNLRRYHEIGATIN